MISAIADAGASGWIVTPLACRIGMQHGALARSKRTSMSDEKPKPKQPKDKDRKPKRPTDPNQLAKWIVDQSTGEDGGETPERDQSELRE